LSLLRSIKDESLENFHSDSSSSPLLMFDGGTRFKVCLDPASDGNTIQVLIAAAQEFARGLSIYQLCFFKSLSRYEFCNAPQARFTLQKRHRGKIGMNRI
jgi:hypothetical protein